MTTLPPGTTRTRRRVLLGAAAAAVVAAAVVGGLSLTGADPGDGGAGAAAGTTAPAPSDAVVAVTAAPQTSVPPAPPTPEPAGETSNADAPPPSVAAVALDQEAAVGNGVTAVVESLEAVQGTATGPGNVAGPALRATVQLTNGTGAPVSLDAVTVELATGEELDPASPLDDASELPFRGMVAPGESAQGVYVFTVPTEARDVVTVTVGYQAGAPVLVFTGSAS